MPYVKIDIVGKRLGRLFVTEFSRRNKRGLLEHLVECDCGNSKYMVSGNIRRSALTIGYRISGCGNCESQSDYPKEYRAWRSMKTRCYNKNFEQFHRYGGRGITVCDAWLNDFNAFFAHIGKASSPEHSVDRKDNDGNYEPGNVKWSTALEQANNRHNTLMEK